MSLTKTFTAEHVGDLLTQVAAWLRTNAPTAIHAVENEAANIAGHMTGNVLWTEPGETAADDNAPPNPNAPTIDKDGLPWDARIHAGSKGLNKDGTWRYRKGVAKDIITAVEAEIKAKLGAMIGVNNPLAATTTAANVSAGQQMQPGNPHQPNPLFPMPGGGIPPMPMGDGGYVPQQHVNPTPMPQQPAVQQMGPMSFGDFMTRFVKLTQTVNPATGNAAINQTTIPALCQFVAQMVGRPINAITDIANDPNAIGVAVNKLIADGVWHLVA